MLAQCIRASRQSITRAARQQVIFNSRRTYVPSAIRSADLVQNMYLKELAGYKPAPVAASDAEGHVQKFAAPKAPKSPEETDLANELKEYETQQVEIEGQATAESGSPVEQDWFEEEEDTKPAGASH